MAKLPSHLLHCKGDMKLRLNEETALNVFNHTKLRLEQAIPNAKVEFEAVETQAFFVISNVPNGFPNNKISFEANSFNKSLTVYLETLPINRRKYYDIEVDKKDDFMHTVNSEIYIHAMKIYNFLCVNPPKADVEPSTPTGKLSISDDIDLDDSTGVTTGGGVYERYIDPQGFNWKDGLDYLQSRLEDIDIDFVIEDGKAKINLEGFAGKGDMDKFIFGEINTNNLVYEIGYGKKSPLVDKLLKRESAKTKTLFLDEILVAFTKVVGEELYLKI